MEVQGNCNIITTAPFFGGTVLRLASLALRFATILESLCTSETCLRHRRLLTCTTNVQSWKIFSSIIALLPSHRSLRSLKLPRISSRLLLLRFGSHSLPSQSDAVHSELSHVVQVSSYIPFFNSALRASVALRETCRAPVRIRLAVINFQNGEQQSRSGSDKKRRNRLR